MSLQSTSDRARSCFSEMHIRKFRKATNFVAEHKEIFCIASENSLRPSSSRGSTTAPPNHPKPHKIHDARGSKALQGSVSLKETPKYFQDLRLQFCLLAFKKVYIFPMVFQFLTSSLMNMFVWVFHGAPDPRMGEKSLLWFWQQALRCECSAVQGSYHSCITQWK